MDFSSTSPIWNGPVKGFLSSKYRTIPQWWKSIGIHRDNIEVFLNYMTFSHIYCICTYSSIALGDKAQWFKLVKQTAISQLRYNTHSHQSIQTYNSQKPLLYSILNIQIEESDSQTTPCLCGSITHSRTNHRDCPLNRGCRCGSTTHFRTTHHQCPLNPINLLEENTDDYDTIDVYATNINGLDVYIDDYGNIYDTETHELINSNDNSDDSDEDSIDVYQPTTNDLDVLINDDDSDNSDEDSIEVYQDTINGLDVLIDNDGNIYDIDTHEIINPIQNEPIEIKPSPSQSELLDIDCSICMDPNDKSPKTKGHCNHTFHTKCIQQWVLAQTKYRNTPTCPLCRCNFVK